MLIQITNKNYKDDKISYNWEGTKVIINHNFNCPIICQIYDSLNKMIFLQIELISDNSVGILFPQKYMPTQGNTYSLIISAVKDENNIQNNDSVKEEYYAGQVKDVLMFCKSLNIGNGKLSKVTDEMVQKYMRLVNGHIDSYLQQYYFVPIRRYNRVRLDGTLQKVFPGKIRLVALQWTSGLLLQSEFQNLQPNQNESVIKYIEQARKQIYQLTIYNARIPGLRWKANGISHFAPPELMPSKNPQRMQ